MTTADQTDNVVGATDLVTRQAVTGPVPVVPHDATTHDARLGGNP
ncbi:hypothetical protein SAMN05421505_101263 [Sinosporangium album]|uniref:Uncharacterized protein n=1 Tax=Sinosporangium album TaxID=504805 RepID=A0A1G7R5G2_9ACTN|nr:hypothetical protein SAMN05421505_101263 [Sinosporangium album]